jgi:hypothetical protein
MSDVCFYQKVLHKPEEGNKSNLCNFTADHETSSTYLLVPEFFVCETGTYKMIYLAEDLNLYQAKETIQLPRNNKYSDDNWRLCCWQGAVHFAHYCSLQRLLLWVTAVTYAQCKKKSNAL